MSAAFDLGSEELAAQAAGETGTAATPGQADEIPAAFGGWVRIQFPADYVLPKNEIAGRWKHMTGPAEREFWREVETALAAQPQDAPELAAAMAETRHYRELVGEMIATVDNPRGRAAVGIQKIRDWRKRAGLPS